MSDNVLNVPVPLVIFIFAPTHRGVVVVTVTVDPEEEAPDILVTVDLGFAPQPIAK